MLVCVFNFIVCFVSLIRIQKTGNAIRALGRMVTLSASRRNSGISSNGHSNTNSPRPSIAAHHLPSLDENRETKVKFDTGTSMMGTPLKNKNLKINNCERSDSGFSEVVEDPFEGKENNGESHKIIPPELLIQKLEEIAENRIDDNQRKASVKIPIVRIGVVQERAKKLTEKYEKSKSPEIKPINKIIAAKKSQIDSKITSKDVKPAHSIPNDIPIQTKSPETTKNSNPIPTNMSPSQTNGVRRNHYTPKKLVIQPNSKTALLRQKFENNCKANEQPHVRNFRTK